jgi:predicted permease
MNLIRDLARDLRHAVRMLRRTRGFTATAVLVLAIGIGTNTAVFSVINAVLLQPLPYPDPDRLIQLRTETRTGKSALMSVQKFLHLRDSLRSIPDLAAWQAADPGANLTGTDRPEHVRALHVSQRYFDVFGATIRFGRTFSAEEDRTNGPPVVIISHGLWVRRFGSRPHMVGEAIEIGGVAHEVIGIVGPSFTPSPAADLWLPLRPDPLTRDHTNFLHVAARLSPITSLSNARPYVASATPAFRLAHPLALGPYETFAAEGLREALVGDLRAPLQLLATAVVFVLLIACANAANLLLARGNRRRRELATRTALGAGRGRLVRQLLTESSLLSLGGGVLGLGLGYTSAGVLFRMAQGRVPTAEAAGVALDGRVLLFTFAVSIVTGVLFGVLPAVSASRTNLSDAFKDASIPSDAGIGRRGGIQSALVVAEITLAIVLLVGAGLMIRTVAALRTIDRGFDPHHVAMLDMSLAGTTMDSAQALTTFIRNVEERVRSMSGVVAVAAARSVPLEMSFALPFQIDGRPLGPGGPYHGIVVWRSVSPEFFDVFRIRLIAGRTFTRNDVEGSAPVVIINRAMARKYWDRTADPSRDRLLLGVTAGPEFADAPRHIVGVVDDVRDTDVNRDPEPTVYVPLAQVGDRLTARNNRLFPLTLAVRTSMRPSEVTGAVAAELRFASAGLPVARIRLMEEIVARTSDRAAFSMSLLSAFAAVALALAIVGLYGLMSYSVQQRTHEIGIRIALGAVPGDVRNMVLTEGLRLAAFGVALGVAASLLLTRLMVTLVFGVETHDPAVFGGVAALLSIVSLVAAYIPAMRATRVSPIDALRA